MIYKYVYVGHLTGYVNDVQKAQEYLTKDNMVKYLDNFLRSVITSIKWDLKNDGNSYEVIALANQPLDLERITALTQWVSAQNSDGLGECFEQQPFAWNEDDEPDYYGEDEDGEPIFEESNGEMVSFDWQTNESSFFLQGVI